MSIWWYGKDKDGKKSITSISIPYPIFVIVFGMIIAVVAPLLSSGKLPPQFIINTFFLCSGFLLFFISELYQFKRGIWTTWGWRDMPAIGKAFYLAGYLLMGYGAIKLLLLWEKL